MMSPPGCHLHDVTSMMSPPGCHLRDVTSVVSPPRSCDTESSVSRVPSLLCFYSEVLVGCRSLQHLRGQRCGSNFHLLPLVLYWFYWELPSTTTVFYRWFYWELPSTTSLLPVVQLGAAQYNHSLLLVVLLGAAQCCRRCVRSSAEPIKARGDQSPQVLDVLRGMKLTVLLCMAALLLAAAARPALRAARPHRRRSDRVRPAAVAPPPPPRPPASPATAAAATVNGALQLQLSRRKVAGEREREEEEDSAEKEKRSDDPPISVDLTFHLLREVLEMARAEQLAQQASDNRRMMDIFGK
ncbi:hypothetical protein CRUP_015855 [Coryphaenoides rupestris]|nr:hypothetical protein CRUP_015855 [Coryphaenoides rupestris]